MRAGYSAKSAHRLPKRCGRAARGPPNRPAWTAGGPPGSAALAYDGIKPNLRRPPIVKTLSLLLLVILATAGCASGARRPESAPSASNGPTNVSEQFSNAQAYDKYVVTRAAELREQGKSPAEAKKVAEKEATGRYGARRSGQVETRSVSVGSWGDTRQEPRELRPQEIDQALAKSRR